jgi:hypothetical protein
VLLLLLLVLQHAHSVPLRVRELDHKLLLSSLLLHSCSPAALPVPDAAADAVVCFIVGIAHDGSKGMPGRS